MVGERGARVGETRHRDCRHGAVHEQRCARGHPHAPQQRAGAQQRPAADRQRAEGQQQRRGAHHVAVDHRRPGGALGDVHEQQQRQHRERHARAAGRQPEPERRAGEAAEHDRQLVDPHQVAPGGGEHRGEALGAFQFGGEHRGGVQRVERVAGDERVDYDPHQRRGGHQRRVAEERARRRSGHSTAIPQSPGIRSRRRTCRHPATRPRPESRARRPHAPQPVHAREHPRVGAQQAGEREQHEHRRAAARALDLQGRRPHNQREIGEVEVALRGEVGVVQTRQHQQRGERRHKRPKAEAREPEETGGERHERGDRAEHHQPRAGLPEERAQRAEGHRQRVLGGRAVDAEVGQLQVQQVTPPQQRVEGVVGGVSGEGEVAHERRHAERRETEPRPRGARHGAQARKQ